MKTTRYSGDQTREMWLLEAIEWMRLNVFADYPIPKLRVSIGLPAGRNSKNAIGQCWPSHASPVDKRVSIFISPTIDKTDLVLEVLVHELVHAHLDNKSGHGSAFKRVALAVGLAGPMTSTSAGPELATRLKAARKWLGEIPHSRLLLSHNPVKKQGTRMIKMFCPTCGYIARAAMKNILENGPVFCPCNREMMSIEAPGGDPEEGTTP